MFSVIKSLNPPPINVDASDYTFKKWFMDVWGLLKSGVEVPSPINYSSGVQGQLVRKNAVLNGDFSVWQRGTSFAIGAVNSTYTADRWTCGRGAVAGMTISRQTGPAGFNFCLRAQRNSGNTSNADLTILQNLPSYESTFFAGQQSTLSFWLKAGADYSGDRFEVRVFTGTGTDENRINANYTGGVLAKTITIHPTTTWTKYTYTFPVASGITQIGLMFSARGLPSTAAGTNDYFDITGVQYEIGSSASLFQYETFREMVSMCRYYYQKSFSYATTPAQNAGDVGVFTFPCIVAGAAGNNSSTMSFQGKMRKTPTFTFYNPHAANALAWNYQRSNSSTALSTNGLGEGTTAVSATGVFGSWVVGDLIGFHWTADAEF